MKNLTAKQQKWLKKNKRKKGVGEISQFLNLSLLETEKLLGIKNISDVPKSYEKYVLFSLLFFAFLIFATSLPNKFVSDDIATILNNPYIGQWSQVGSSIWGSIQKFVYFIFVNLIGLVPWPIRLSNIFFHLTTTWLLYQIVRRAQNFSVSIMAAALYVVAPVISEPVIWISSMPYVLGGMFTMLTIYFHLDEEKTKVKNFLEIIAWTGAIISSEKYLFIPVLLLFWDWYKNRLNKTSTLILLLFSLSLFKGISLLSFFTSRVTTLNLDYYSSAPSRMENPIAKLLVAIGFYVKLYFWPKALTLYQSEINLNGSNVILFGSVFIISILAFWQIIRRHRDLWFWVAFMLLSLLVVLFPFNVSSLVAERYGYLFYSGLAVILAVAINDLFRARIAILVTSLICLTMSVRTLIRIQDWKDADTLWFSAAPYSPSSFQNHNNLGDAYSNRGDYQKAIEEFTKGIQINPRYADAMHNRANIYLKLGDTQKAKDGYLEAYSNNPRLWQSLIRIAEIEANQGNWQVAIDTMKKAYDIYPSSDIAGWLKMLEEKAAENQYNK